MEIKRFVSRSDDRLVGDSASYSLQVRTHPQHLAIELGTRNHKLNEKLSQRRLAPSENIDMGFGCATVIKVNLC